ncbi:MAG: hypothetical protein GF401_12500 [Chitinivibrionales bacterium]|nr:hypothetical protein [Chitinivibrionales bacterium]
MRHVLKSATGFVVLPAILIMIGLGCDDENGPVEDGQDTVQTQENGNDPLKNAVDEVEEIGRQARKRVDTLTDQATEGLNGMDVEQRIDNIISSARDRIVRVRRESGEATAKANERIEDIITNTRKRVNALIDSVTND